MTAKDPAKPVFSVIIPTCNRPSELRVSLTLLSQQLDPSWSIDFLVLDDGSTDLTQDIVTAAMPSARLIRGPQRGPAANRNFGASHAGGSWLVFLDDDCLPREAFLRTYWNFITANSDFANARIALEGSTYRIGSESLLFEAPHSPNGGALISCNFAIPRNLFLEFGGFDERFPTAAFEDTDLAARLERRNVKFQFLPDAAVDHAARPIPSARSLASRWECRVISTYDYGASTSQLVLRLPKHIVSVILSRFRKQPIDAATMLAAIIFAVEFAHVLWLMPKWIRKHRKGPRNPFWIEEVQRGLAPCNYGL